MKRFSINLDEVRLRKCNEIDYKFIHDLSRENMEKYVERNWGGWSEKELLRALKKKKLKLQRVKGKELDFIS